MDGGSYKCPDCDDWFLSRYALAQHLKETHPQVPLVLNRRDFAGALPPNCTYIGRGSPYGNRFHIGRDGERDEVIDSYIAEKSRDETFLAMVRRQLRGRNLVCHCAPKPCHGNWLLQVANAYES